MDTRWVLILTEYHLHPLPLPTGPVQKKNHPQPINCSGIQQKSTPGTSEPVSGHVLVFTRTHISIPLVITRKQRPWSVRPHRNGPECDHVIRTSWHHHKSQIQQNEANNVPTQRTHHRDTSSYNGPGLSTGSSPWDIPTTDLSSFLTLVWRVLSEGVIPKTTDFFSFFKKCYVYIRDTPNEQNETHW